MERRPITALRVKNLDRSLRFYHEGLGFGLDWQQEGAAQVQPFEGLPLLLVAEETSDPERWMHPDYRSILAPGRRLYLTTEQDLAAYREGLLARGLQPGAPDTEGDGSAILEVVDPDGYLVRFWQPPALSDEEIIAQFAAGPAHLAEVLEGLTEEQLDLSRAPGKWSIRQLVHHMADSDATSLVRLLMALAQPGRPFANNPYSQDAWVDGLDAAHRPIAPSLALVTAIRAHITALVRHLPGALDRSLETSLAGRVTVRRMLLMLGSHMLHHTAQIRQTRQVHGL